MRGVQRAQEPEPQQRQDADGVDARVERRVSDQFGRLFEPREPAFGWQQQQDGGHRQYGPEQQAARQRQCDCRAVAGTDGLRQQRVDRGESPEAVDDGGPAQGVAETHGRQRRGVVVAQEGDVDEAHRRHSQLHEGDRSRELRQLRDLFAQGATARQRRAHGRGIHRGGRCIRAFGLGQRAFQAVWRTWGKSVQGVGQQGLRIPPAIWRTAAVSLDSGWRVNLPAVRTGPHLWSCLGSLDLGTHPVHGLLTRKYFL